MTKKLKNDFTEEKMGTTAEELHKMEAQPRGKTEVRERTIPPEQETCPRGCNGHLYWAKRKRGDDGQIEPPAKICYACNELWIVDGEDDLQKLQRDFDDALNVGLQDVIVEQARSNLKHEFALEDDFFAPPTREQIERAAQDELAFTNNVEDFIKQHPTSQNTKNFLVRIRARYAPVDVVRNFVRNLDNPDSLAREREKALIWATWNGFNKRVHFAKKQDTRQVAFRYQRRVELPTEQQATC